METSETKKFTKSDYLTVLQVSKQLNQTPEIIYRAMHVMYLKRATVLVQSGKTKAPRPSVIIARYHNRNSRTAPIQYRLRSDALEQITDFIQSKQEKGK